MQVMRVGMDGADLESLGRSRLFTGLSPAAIGRLVAGAIPRLFVRGKVLFQEGDPANVFFVVLSGWVKVYRHSPSGEEAVFGVFGVGETFAEAAMFFGDGYPASAEVVEDARLIPLRCALIRQRLMEEPEICLSMLSTMSMHLHHMAGQVEQLQTRSSAQRLANFLVRMCPVREGSAVVTLPYDKSLIAARLGMKPESLSRALSHLRAYGVTSDGNRLLIGDVARLTEYCELGPMRGGSLERQSRRRHAGASGLASRRA